jgi:hypothetical protein
LLEGGGRGGGEGDGGGDGCDGSGGRVSNGKSDGAACFLAKMVMARPRQQRQQQQLLTAAAADNAGRRQDMITSRCPEGFG